jgi:signal transduction histidine kinase
MNNLSQKICLLFFICFYPLQGQIDSLEKVVKTQKGIEKIRTLSELCYQFSTTDIKKSISYGCTALALANQQKDTLLIAAVANDLSLPYLYQGNYDSCIALAKLAYDLRLKKKETLLAANALSKVALGYYEKGNLKDALQYNFEVEKIYITLNQYLLAAKIQNNIGSIFEKNGQVEEAKTWYKKSADLNYKEKDWLGYITAECNTAIAERKLGRITHSEKMLLDIIPLCEKEGRPEQLSQIYQALGVTYRELKDTKKGLFYYLKSREIYEKIGSDIGLSSIDANIGNCYRDLGDLNNAEKYLLNSLASAKKSKSWSYLKTPLEGLFELETKRGNFAKANQYLYDLLEVKDSLYSEETKNKIANLQVKYATAEKENRLLQQKIEISQSYDAVRKRNYWILGLLLMVALSGIIFVNYFQKQLAQKRKLALESKLKLQEERIRISRDLHDNMGAEITLISSLLDTKAFQSKSTDEKKELENIANMSRRAMSNLRETIWTISDEAISIERLGLKINEFAVKICTASHIKLVYANTIKENKNIEPILALNLFRMVQEIINNSVKHAKASEISIALFTKANQNYLVIKDNGIGFNELETSNGNGLNNLKSRADENKIGLLFNTTNGVEVQLWF